MFSLRHSPHIFIPQFTSLNSVIQRVNLFANNLDFLSTLSSHLIWKTSKPKYLYAKSNYLCSHYCIREAKYCKTPNEYLYWSLSLCKLLSGDLTAFNSLHLLSCFQSRVTIAPLSLYLTLPCLVHCQVLTSLHISQKKIEPLYLPTIDSIIILHQMEPMYSTSLLKWKKSLLSF